jgi:hypothetical protein
LYSIARANDAPALGASDGGPYKPEVMHAHP